MDEKIGIATRCLCPGPAVAKAMAEQIRLRGLETSALHPGFPVSFRPTAFAPLGHRKLSPCSWASSGGSNLSGFGPAPLFATQPNVCIRATEWLEVDLLWLPFARAATCCTINQTIWNIAGSPTAEFAARRSIPWSVSNVDRRTDIRRLGTQNAECRSWTSTDDFSNSPAVDPPPAPNAHPSPRPKKLWLSRDVGSGRMSRCCRKCR